MRELLSRLRAGEILVADGAMGSLLLKRGLSSGECPESFNLKHGEVLEEIARLYLEAGADIIQTNTFGGSPAKLAMYGLDSQTEEINRSAVEAVHQAVDGRAYVSGSCGPSGKTLKPYGETDPEELYQGFERQIRVLVENGVNLICVETMTDLTEAALAVKAAKAVSGTVPVAATMTFDRTARGFYTIMGVDISAAITGLADAGADILGSNCGSGIEDMLSIAREFAASTDLPLIIQSNAGLPELKGDQVTYKEPPEFMAAKVPELIAAGVSIIGGCCGTTPAHIRAIRNAVDSRHP